MQKRTRIKVCGLTQEAQLLACVDMGVDAIGLVFYDKSPRAVTVSQAESLLKNVPPFVTTVGLFLDPPEALVREAKAALPLDLLQFHGAESGEFCQRFDHAYIRSVPMGGDGVSVPEFIAQYPLARGFLYDSNAPGQMGGSGHSFDWQKLRGECDHAVILAGGLNVENVRQAVEQVRPFAVDVSSGVERGKGDKDLERVAAFIREVRCADEGVSASD